MRRLSTKKLSPWEWTRAHCTAVGASGKTALHTILIKNVNSGGGFFFYQTLLNSIEARHCNSTQLTHHRDIRHDHDVGLG